MKKKVGIRKIIQVIASFLCLLLILPSGSRKAVADTVVLQPFSLLNDQTYSGSAGDYTNFGTTDFDFSQGFEIRFLARWDAMGSQNAYSRILDFGNGANSDNIVIMQNSTSNTMILVVLYNSTYNEVSVPNAITLGETANWRFDVDSTGYCKIYKNENLVVQQPFLLPRSITRSNCYIAKSNWSTDGVFQGRIADLGQHRTMQYRVRSGKIEI